MKRNYRRNTGASYVWRVEWYDNNQSTLQGIIDCMKESYLTNKSDYEEMFGL
jgi:hypothetical protein